MLQRVGHDLATEQQKDPAEHSYNIRHPACIEKDKTSEGKRELEHLFSRAYVQLLRLLLSTVGSLCSPASILLSYLTTVTTLELGEHSHPLLLY